MSTNEYRYVIELFREDDSPLGQASVKIDWGPAEEWARFEALRRGPLGSNETGRVRSIEPLWLRGVGEPYLEGFRVNVIAREGEVATDFSSSYFKGLASQASSHFIEKGRLETGERFRYLAAAFREQTVQPNGSRFQFTTEEVARPVAIKASSLAEAVAEAVPHGTICAGDVSVFVPQCVLDEAATLSREAGAKETGGILIGHLHRDATVPDVFVEVTAQIHARHTEADLTKLTFTAQTWTEVQGAIDLRRRGEIMLGWWHSHPVREWCKDCSAERQQVCKMAGDFFSAHDHALHRTVFPGGYSIALVANDLPSGEVTFSAFGWRDALIESRGFHVIADPLRAAPARTSSEWLDAELR
ncbi:MAG: Mov34/MPN/PAD-1 family protein [Acidobacteriota bacterium]